MSLFITTALSTMALNSPAIAQYAYSTQQAYDAFHASQYNYCDAKLVGELWNLDVSGGKITIGQKILNRINSDIPILLAQSRAAQNKCFWEDTGYDYNDAVIIAQAWNLGIADAKWAMAQKMTHGQSRLVDQVLGR